jgi:hypothetical protein
MKPQFSVTSGDYEPAEDSTESLMSQDHDEWQDEEKNGLSTQRIRSRRCDILSLTLSAFKSTLNTILLVIILVFLLKIDFDHYRSIELEVGGDITGWGPKSMYRACRNV